MATNNNGGPRSQPSFGVDALSSRPQYDFPSPTSNYPSDFGSASPGFYPMAYQISPRFGGSAFIPPTDVFAEGKGVAHQNSTLPLRDLRKRNSDVLNEDPVAMHLLVETAMIDSRNFDMLSVDEVEALKQEQKGLHARLVAARRKLETETKIRDATRSLSRLTSKSLFAGGQRSVHEVVGRGSNGARDTPTRSEEELGASNNKVNDLSKELLEVESRMRLIDMQLLTHTAAVLQLTHNGPARRKQNSQLPGGEDRRPDSPASLFTYEKERGDRDDHFDERSFYRSPENLHGLMDALQNGTHHNSAPLDQQHKALDAVGKRVQDVNQRLRGLLVQAHPERNGDYAAPPAHAPATSDDASVDRSMDYLEQAVRDLGAEQTTKRDATDAEERLEGINNQLYAMVSRADDTVPAPPAGADDGLQAHMDYMEDTFYNLGQVQYSLHEQIEDLRAKAAKDDGAEKYETTLQGLWQIIQAGEEEARERKRERRQTIAQDPDNDEELSADEDFIANESFSLAAFSSKVQLLFSRATNLKHKQSILMRQIKQQRELNNKSDAQKEAEVSRLNQQILSSRSEKKSMEGELERAMSQLRQFDEQKMEADVVALKEAQARVQSLEGQLREAVDSAQMEAASIRAELAASAARTAEANAALETASTAHSTAESRAIEVTSALAAKDGELRSLEGEVVRLTTELTFAKAELDAAYGTRAERAAESGASTKKELDDLLAKNASLAAELASMAGEYEGLTRDAIQNEKDRDALEACIDRLRDDKEGLELELSDEKVRWMGAKSPSVAGAGPTGNGQPDMGATSIRMLREDFRKMMRERVAEGLRALRTEQEERRKLEALVRQLRKDPTSSASSLLPPSTPAVASSASASVMAQNMLSASSAATLSPNRSAMSRGAGGAG